MHFDTQKANALSSASIVPVPRLTGLVLMGGGARTAYQAGALQAIGQLLGASQMASCFPF